MSSYAVVPHAATKKGLERFAISALAFFVKSRSTRYFVVVYAYGEGFTVRDTRAKIEELARSVTTKP